MKAPSQDIYTAEMGPQALSTCAQWKKESLKTKVTEDTDEKGSNNTNIGKVGKGAEHLSRGCSGPVAGKLVCLRELQHTDGLKPHVKIQSLTFLFRVLSESVILFPKTLYKELQPFHVRKSKQRDPTFDLTPELTCSIPTTWDRHWAPANKPPPPR